MDKDGPPIWSKQIIGDRKRAPSGELGTVPCPRLQLRSVCLERALTKVTLSLDPGVASLLGVGGSGKTLLLEIAAGLRKPNSGSVAVSERVHHLPDPPPAKAAPPQKRLRSYADAGRILEAFDLWDVRAAPGRSLTPSQRVGAALADACSMGPEVLLVDCSLDALPTPVALRALDELHRLARLGCAVLVGTRMAWIAERTTRVILLDEGRILADDSPERLVTTTEGEEIEVETADPLALRQIMEPWRVRVEEVAGGLRFVTAEGQERVNRLLQEGYGTVRAVVRRTATLADAWERLRREARRRG